MQVCAQKEDTLAVNKQYSVLSEGSWVIHHIWSVKAFFPRFRYSHQVFELKVVLKFINDKRTGLNQVTLKRSLFYKWIENTRSLSLLDHIRTNLGNVMWAGIMPQMNARTDKKRNTDELLSHYLCHCNLLRCLCLFSPSSEYVLNSQNTLIKLQSF